MTSGLTRTFPAMVLAGLLAIATAAAEENDFVLETQDAPVTGKVLLEAASHAAVNDAIEAVLVDNRMDLDIRFAGHTSETIVDGP